MKKFQILSLSGGGFRGLYTAQILNDIEQEIGAPIATRFDLISGTSIGGIIALALSLEISAERIVRLFQEEGGNIFKKRFSLLGMMRSSFSSDCLRELLLSTDFFGERLLGSCLHPVIVPAINYSTGKPQIFKTPHHDSFKRDHTLRIADIALATSAAPAYFPRHTFNHSQYVDGGLFANAPGMLALHEALTFMGQSVDQLFLVSIGTMSSKFTVNPNKNRWGGTFDWGGINPANMPKRLFGLSISVQESLCDFMLKHQLKDRYIHIDDDLTDERAKAVALDKADAGAIEVLMGAAKERSKFFIGSEVSQSILNHVATVPVFYYGANARKGV